MAAARDRRRRRRGVRLRGPAGRRAVRRGGPGAVRSRRARPTTRRSPRRRAPWRSRCAPTQRPTAIAELSGAGRSAAQTARRGRRHRLLRRQRPRDGGGLCSGLEARLDEDEAVPDKATAIPRQARFGDASEQDLGDATRRLRRPHRQRLADPPLHRSGGALQVRAGKGYAPSAGELRFDMFEAEFTHEGDSCTFEVLLERGGLNDPALRAIAEIVHDIDLKDDKFGRTEVAGIRTLIDGIASRRRTIRSGSRAAPRCSTTSTSTSRRNAGSRD